MDKEYRDSVQGTSVVCSNQLWNFVGVVSVLMLADDWMYQFHGRWFHLSVE
jgi:hypothetical protein